MKTYLTSMNEELTGIILPFRLFITLLVFIIPSILIAQKDIRFDHFSMRDGLPDNAITCITQDSRGFMWFGTYKGVSRFDGYDFLNFQYDVNDSNSLQGDLISCILEDHLGKIWIGSSSNGISVYDPEKGLFKTYKSGKEDSAMIANYSIRVIFEDSDQFLWIGTEFGLSVISPDRNSFKKYYCETLPCEESINGKIVYDIVEDGEKRIWIATENQKLSVFDKKTNSFSSVQYTTLPLSNPDDNILKNLCLYQDSLLWIASNNGGLTRLNIETLKSKTYLPDINQNSISSNHIRDIKVVKDELWLAVDGFGIDILNLETNQFTNYQKSKVNQKSLSKNAIWTLYEDKQGIVWIGTFQGGINKYDPKSNFFQLIGHNPLNEKSLPNEPVISIFRDSKQHIWVGTDWGGLHMMETNDNFHHYLHNDQTPSISTNVIKSISEDKSGKLLLGTYNHGMCTFDTKRGIFKHFRHENVIYQNLPSNNIWTMYKDSRKISWVGTLGGGIAIYDSDRENFLSVPIDYQGGELYHIYHIYEDAQSNLWFSTDGGLHLYHRRTESWSTMVLSEHLKTKNHKVNQVRAVIEDKYRHIWMATAAGLILYLPEKNEFKLYDEQDGISQLPLLDLIEDDFGNLLLVSKTYITQFDLSRQTVTSYHVSENSLNYNAMLKTKDGSIMIGGDNGITTFNPKNLSKNEYVPAVYITEFLIFNQVQLPNLSNSVLNQTIEETNEINIDYDQSVINFKYTALNFSESSRNQFAYQLVGFDEDWQYVQDRRMATYTNLDPGSYTFTVKASNNHGVWNNEGATIKLIVHPPFWSTSWFRILVFLIIVTLLYLIQKMRNNQIRRKYEFQQIKIQQELTQVKSETLKNELDTTKNEMNNITMSYLHKNQKLLAIRQKIVEASKKIESSDRRWTDRVIKEIDKEIEDHDYWDKFELQFNHSHDNFLERFKTAYPELSKRELRICAYLRMGLDNNEISILMNVTLRTIEQSRYRIRKKIDLEERQSFTKMILRF